MESEQRGDQQEGAAGECGLFECNPAGKKSENLASLPLRKVAYTINICDGIAEVNQTQIYFNHTNKFMDVQFRFPVPPAACLHRFVATFGENKIFGVIKEKVQAKKEYQSAVKEGRRAAYGEIKSESRDIMVVQIGNIGPGISVNIQISHIEELKVSLNTFYAYDLQTKMTPRYLNHIPKEEFLNAFRKSAQSVSGQFEWDFVLNVKSSRKIIFFQSSTHALAVESQNDQKTALSFTLNRDNLMKNFSFMYTTQNFHLPSFIMGKNDASTTVMVSFIPKFCTLSLGDAERAAFNKESLDFQLESVKGEYIFLIDQSGSMQGNNIENAKRALILFLKSLPVDSYFNVISFGSDSKKMYGESQKNSNHQIAHAIQRIKSFKANLGGTEIQTPLLEIFTSKLIPGYSKQIFLLTDGAVQDTERTIQLVRKNVKYSRVHTIGIGNGVSRNLIEGCAQKGKGKCVFIKDNEDPAEKVIHLLSESFSATVSSVELQYDRELVRSIVPNPSSIPYILKGQAATFYITFKGVLQSQTLIQFSYMDSLNKLPFSSTVTINPESENIPFIDKMGYFKTIKALEDSQQSNASDSLYYAKLDDKNKEIIDLSIRNQVLSTLTAFLCCQTALIDGKYEEIKDTGKVSINILSQKVGESGDFAVNFSQSHSRGRGSAMASKTSRIKQSYNDSGYSRICRRSIRSYQPSDESNSPPNRDCRMYYRMQIPQSEQYDRRKSRSRSRSRDQSSVRRMRQARRSPQRQIERTIISNKQTEIEHLMANIVSQQQIQGFWMNGSILKNLYSHEELKSLPQDGDKSVAITILILKWIKEHIKSKEYDLIVRKAVQWLNNQGSFEEYAAKYGYKQ